MYRERPQRDGSIQRLSPNTGAERPGSGMAIFPDYGRLLRWGRTGERRFRCAVVSPAIRNFCRLRHAFILLYTAGAAAKGEAREIAKVEVVIRMPDGAFLV